MQANNKLFYAKIAMRGACTESPREWLDTRLRQGYGGQAAGAYLVQAPACHAWTLGEGRAVPSAYCRSIADAHRSCMQALSERSDFVHTLVLCACLFADCVGTPSFTQLALFAKKYFYEMPQKRCGAGILFRNPRKRPQSHQKGAMPTTRNCACLSPCGPLLMFKAIENL